MAMTGQPQDENTEETHVLSLTPATESSGSTGRSTMSGGVEPTLVLVKGDLPRIVFRLKPGCNAIGRGAESDIRISHRIVSHLHAEVVLAEGHAVLRDAGSRNGTLLNGVALREPTLLRVGDVITIGSCNFKYEDRKLDVEFIESLHTLGTRDALTGMANKAHIVTLLEDALAAAGEDSPVALILLDFDGFKSINDTYGHLAGDHVLKESAQLIRDHAIRNEDHLGRFGGEEFAVVLPATNVIDAGNAAERIRKTVEQHPFEYDGQPIRVTASLGVSASAPGLLRSGDLVRVADALLYQSKREGRNRVTLHAPG